MTLGFIGLGAMGFPIALNLVKAGFNLKIYTRSCKYEKYQQLKGAIACNTLPEIALDCSVIFICVSDDKAIEDVLFSSLAVSYTHLRAHET